MTKNTGRAYERHIFNIIDKVLAAVMGRKHPQVTFKYDARVQGTDGIIYQVDILGQTAGELFLIECKDYKGEIDYKVIAAFISKCVDISNMYPDKTVYALVVDKSGFHPSAVSMKNKKIWLAPEVDFERQVKLLRIGPRIVGGAVVVYEFEKNQVRHTPVLLSAGPNLGLDETVNYLKTGSDFGLRVSRGLELLNKLDERLAGNSEDAKLEVELLCYENISNSFLHLGEYFDALYFSNRILKAASRVKDPNILYEAQLISTIATYKRLQAGRKGHVARPGRKKVLEVYRQLNVAAGMSKAQAVSTKLFLGLWLARHEDYELAMPHIRESQMEASSEDFRDSRWHYFVSLLRAGEVERDKDRAADSLSKAAKLLDDLCDKHKVVGAEFLTRITGLRA